MPPTLQLTLLGTLQICIDDNRAEGFRSQKAQALLCYLATQSISNNRAHSRSALSGLLWGDSPEEQARASLRQALSNISELCEGALIATRHSVAFNRHHPYTLDTESFEQAATRLITQPTLVELYPALDLYQGDFLDGFTLRSAPEFETWTLGLRAHYRQLALQAYYAVAQACATMGDLARAITYHRRLLHIEPWHEASHRQLMALLAQTGQRSAALDQFRLLTQLLVDELGVEPEAATQLLYEEIKKKREGDTPLLSTYTPPLPASLPVSLPTSLPPATPPALPPFVGRANEIATLTRALETMAAGEGQLRFVTGSAGEGKSTLVREFVRQTQATNPKLLALTGYCNAYTGSSDPYLPFRQMLSLLTGEVEGQSAQGQSLQGQAAHESVRANAHRLWHSLPDTLAALVENAPDLIGSLISAPALLERATALIAASSPATSQPAWLQTLITLCTTPQANPLEEGRIFTQFSALIHAISKQRPLIIILEDLHWADLPSCGLLFHLSRSLEAKSLLIIATYRPTEIPTNTPNGPHPLVPLLAEFKRQHGAIWLHLDTRNAATSRAFVEAYLDTQPNLLDDTFRNALFQRTGGHALFTVELLRELQERGDLFKDGNGHWLARPEIDWNALPAKIEGVIERHLGTLEGRAHAILRAAAVQGEIFTAEVIAQLLQEGEQAIVFTLSQELGQKQRLVSSQEQLWIGTRRLSHYTFRHFLFQDYLYRSLDDAERIYLHEAVGNALEHLYGEESVQIAAELAYHFRQAGLLDKAIATHFMAGERALSLSALQEAIHHLSQGLALLDALPVTPARDRQRLDYLDALASSMDKAGNYDHGEIERIYLRARDLCLQLGERRKLWSITYGLYMTFFYRGRHHECYTMGEELLRAGEQEGEIEPTLIALLILGAEAITLTYFNNAKEYLERALVLFDPAAHIGLVRRYSNFDVLVEILASLAQVNWMLGYPDQTARLLEAAMQRGEEATHPFGLIEALLQVTWQLEYHRNFDKCAIYSERLIRLASESDQHLPLCHANMYLAMVMLERGDAEAGLTRLTNAIAALRATGNMMAQGHFADLQGRAYAAVGRLDEAIQVIDDALAASDDNGELFFNAELTRLRGEYLLRQGASLAQVESIFEDAITLARSQEAKMWELRATISLCTLWQQQGNIAAARARLTALYAWFTEGLDTPDLLAARALLDALE